MEVRCASCNKLFRVSDEKITGSGIKFTCTRCNQIVTITREDFELYLAKSSPAVAHVPASPNTPCAVSRQAEADAKAGVADTPDFLSSPAPAASGTRPEEKSAPASARPASPAVDSPSLKPETGTKTEPRPAAAPQPKPEVKPVAKPKSEPAVVQDAPPIKTELKRPAAPMPKPEVKPSPRPKPEPAPAVAASSAALSTNTAAAHREAQRPAPVVLDAAPQRSGGAGKKFTVLFVVLLVIGGGAFAVKSYLANASRQAADAVKQVTAPDGLQIQNASGAVDPGTGDLVITGVVENTTEKPRSDWFIVAEVYDAQGGVLVKGKLWNGKQFYTRRDYETMTKRGMNIQELKQKILQEQGTIIPAKGTVAFEIRIMEPPVGVASFNATLQPFDPVQLFKEMAEEQK